MNRIFQNKVLKVILFYAALYVVTYYAVFGLTTLIIITDTGMKLDTTIYHRQSEIFMDEDDIDKLYDTYKEENVTRVKRYLDWSSQYVYFVDNSFINTGMTAYNQSYNRDIVEKIKLIDGEVWEKGTTDNVMIIDQLASEWLSLDVGDTYTLQDIDYEIVGIVSNLSLPGTDRGMDDPLYVHMVADSENIPRVLYLPYALSSTLLETESDVVDTVIVQSKNIFVVKKDSDSFGSYLEDKLTIDGIRNWTYEPFRAINLGTIRQDETSDKGFSILVYIGYGILVLFIQLGKRYVGKKAKKKSV